MENQVPLTPGVNFRAAGPLTEILFFLTVTAKPTNESFTANDWLQIHVLSYTNMYA